MCYPFTEPLPGLADWSAFLEQDHVNSLLRKQDPRWELHGGHESKIHSSGSEIFLDHLSMFGPIVALIELIASPNSPN